MNKFVQYAILLVIAAVVGIVTSQMIASKSLGKPEIEQIARDFILNNPQVLIDSVNRYQQQQAQNEISRGVQTLKDRKDEIFNSKTSPVIGNPNGDITLVEFFDYQCGYCKRMLPVITQLIEDDKNVRVVIKEYPIFPGSDTISRVALAVHALDKGKYFAFHARAMEIHEEPNEANLLKIAGEIGMDEAKVKEAMAKPEVAEELRKNHELAQGLGVQGTPNFILEEERIPGAMNLEDLRKKIADIRKNKK